VNQPQSPRDRATRIRDTLDRLAHDIDAWIATADPANGTPYLIPLSYLWVDSSLIISTPAQSPTARNLAATGLVRLGLGTTRDVILIEAVAQALEPEELAAELGDAFAVRTGFDPRTLSAPYQYFRLTPRRIQAWREENELSGRELMRDGAWIET
jgi:hypothetical protein